MRVLIAGASGFVGNSLSTYLQKSGHDVLKLVREKSKLSSNTIYWNPETGELDVNALNQHSIDAVINLSGENVAVRWTKEKKEKILKSRIGATSLLSTKIAAMKTPPKVFISASAIGIYGNQGEQSCSENTPSGDGFLADVCRQWEGATLPAESAGIRTIHLRIGIVLSPAGGALGKMLLPFKLCLGGRMGSGMQYMSWIALKDLDGIILFLLTHDKISGKVNAVAPYAATNQRFTEALAKALHRPAFIPMPAGLLRFIFGREMADEFFLASTRVVPKKLIEQGYIFHYPHVEEALKEMLNT
jgi:hypothetical protein